MVARAQAHGYPIEFDGTEWRYSDSGDSVAGVMERSCAACGHADQLVTLCQPREVSGRSLVAVDACLAPFIQMLNDRGVHTLGCCCGHGRSDGSILYEQDGQTFELRIALTGRKQ